MKKEILFEAIGNIDDELLARLFFSENTFDTQSTFSSEIQKENPLGTRAENVPITGTKSLFGKQKECATNSSSQPPENKLHLFKKILLQHPLRYAIVLCTACLILAAIVFLPRLYHGNGNHLFQLSDASYGVKVSLMEKAPEFTVMASSDLIWLSEEELFTRFNTDIFEGSITDIQNIVLDFNGDKNYNAIASIQIEKVFRGNCRVGDTVKVLLPCMIDVEGLWVSDTNVVSQMRVGMHGIFMPMVYDSNSYYEKNGARLLLTDIAPYGFADGERYCFLETQEGLAFARFAYESIAEVTTLAEVEVYVEKMLGGISGQ